jgi:hypothetical protein
MKIHTQGRTFRVTVLAGLVSAALVTSAGPVAPDAMAWHKDEPAACRKAARKRFYSCRLESLEDYNVIYANCDQLDGDARSECRHEARTALNEANQECENRYDERLEACAWPGRDLYDPDPLADRDCQDPGDISRGNPYWFPGPGQTSVFRVFAEGRQTDDGAELPEELRELSPDAFWDDDDDK